MFETSQNFNMSIQSSFDKVVLASLLLTSNMSTIGWAVSYIDNDQVKEAGKDKYIE